VVDNNVLAYFWLPSEFGELAEAAKAKDGMWAAPVLWRSEFRSMLAGYLRRKMMTLPDAVTGYTNCQRDLGQHEYSVPTERVLKFVLASKCSAYDCEYVALADDLGVPLVTTDKQLLNEFPKIAVSLEKFVKSK
jgi:predicted nucleic acid-binding protein